MPVRVPYRLDFTVNALRRLPTNRVDMLTADGTYVRLLGSRATPVIVRVRQMDAGTLSVELDGDRREHPQLLDLIARMLGAQVDLTRFYQGAEFIPWLQPLALRMRGVKPPRYPTLWEACVNAIVFQQLSLVAANEIMRRLVATLGEPVLSDDVPVYRFPDMADFLNAPDAGLRATGLSASKLSTLRRVGEALAGTLNETMLTERSSADAAAVLRGIKGIGSWTAAVVLLRGLGRLDVFPANDTSVARNLTLVAGSGPFDLQAALDVLRPVQGMLYYHLLLARLESRGALRMYNAERAPNTR